MAIIIAAWLRANDSSARRKPLGFFTRINSIGTPCSIIVSPRPNAGWMFFSAKSSAPVTSLPAICRAKAMAAAAFNKLYTPVSCVLISAFLSDIRKTARCPSIFDSSTSAITRLLALADPDLSVSSVGISCNNSLVVPKKTDFARIFLLIANILGSSRFNTTVSIVAAAIFSNSLAVVSISPKRSSWSRMTLSSRENRGCTILTNLTAQASSSSSTAMSASSLPWISTSFNNAAATPREKLLPVRFVKTFIPTDSNSSTTIFVVVVLPLVPLIITTPCGKSSKVRLIKSGSIFSTTRPGKADPPPRNCATFFTLLPIIVLIICLCILAIITRLANMLQ